MKNILPLVLLLSLSASAQQFTSSYQFDTDATSVNSDPSLMFGEPAVLQGVDACSGADSSLTGCGWTSSGSEDPGQNVHFSLVAGSGIAIRLDSIVFEQQGSVDGPTSAKIEFCQDGATGEGCGFMAGWWVDTNAYGGLADVSLEYWDELTFDQSISINLRAWSGGSGPWSILSFVAYAHQSGFASVPELDLTTIGPNDTVEIRDAQGRIVATRLSQLLDLPAAIYVVQKGGLRKKVMMR